MNADRGISMGEWGGGEDWSPGELAVLDAAAVHHTAWVPRKEIEASGHAAAAIDGLIAAGWLEEWPFDDGPMLVITVWAAERLRIEVVEVKASARPRWGRAKPADDREGEEWSRAPSPLPSWGKLPEPEDFVEAIQQPRVSRLPDPSKLVDKRPGPEQEAEEREAAEKKTMHYLPAYTSERGDPVEVEVKLFGQSVPIDHRLGKGGRRAG